MTRLNIKYDDGTEEVELFDSWDEAEEAVCDKIDYEVEAWAGHVSDRDYRHHEMAGEDAKEDLRDSGHCTFYDTEYIIDED